MGSLDWRESGVEQIPLSSFISLLRGDHRGDFGGIPYHGPTIIQISLGLLLAHLLGLDIKTRNTF